MAVSKTTRFQVLKRDGHACQYCGAVAPDAVLTVDHVIPVALGGSDKPGNLVAACKDCNAGKGATNPDSDLVQRLSAEAATYALEMANKVKVVVQSLAGEHAAINRFDEVWNGWTANATGETVSRPKDYKDTIRRWHRQEIPDILLDYAIETAMRNDKVALRDKFRYMCGVVYRKLESVDVSASLLAPGADIYTIEDIDEAFNNGLDFHGLHMTAQDCVAKHIDRMGAPDAYWPMADRLKALLVGSSLKALEEQSNG